MGIHSTGMKATSLFDIDGVFYQVENWLCRANILVHRSAVKLWYEIFRI